MELFRCYDWNGFRVKFEVLMLGKFLMYELVVGYVVNSNAGIHKVTLDSLGWWLDTASLLLKVDLLLQLLSWLGLAVDSLMI